MKENFRKNLFKIIYKYTFLICMRPCITYSLLSDLKDYIVIENITTCVIRSDDIVVKPLNSSGSSSSSFRPDHGQIPIGSQSDSS